MTPVLPASSLVSRLRAPNLLELPRITATTNDADRTLWALPDRLLSNDDGDDLTDGTTTPAFHLPSLHRFAKKAAASSRELPAGQTIGTVASFIFQAYVRCDSPGRRALSPEICYMHLHSAAAVATLSASMPCQLLRGSS